MCVAKNADIPYDKFLFGAVAYLGIRQNKYKPETILYLCPEH